MIMVINPGTGPVAGTKKQARANLKQLLADAGFSGAAVRFVGEGCGGRFKFRIRLDGKGTSVEMPGLPLERVRFMGAEGQSAWNFPRLYVDGSSWLWEFAIRMVRDAFDPAWREREGQ